MSIYLLHNELCGLYQLFNNLKQRSMKISTIKCTMLTLALFGFIIGFGSDANAQYKTYGENIVANGDFSAGDSLWVIEGGN